MKLFNKKFLEFRFTVPKIKIDTNIITISYFKSWIDLFTIRKSQIELNLKHSGGNSYKLSYDNFETEMFSNDVIMLQVYVYQNDLYIVVNPPIHTDQLDADNYTDVFADIWIKSDFKLWKWLNIKLGLNDVGVNFV